MNNFCEGLHSMRRTTDMRAGVTTLPTVNSQRRAGSVAAGWRVVRRPDSERRDSGSLKNVAQGSDTAWGWGSPRAFA